MRKDEEDGAEDVHCDVGVHNSCDDGEDEDAGVYDCKGEMDEVEADDVHGDVGQDKVCDEVMMRLEL